jgi:hypothetical protein
VGLNFETIDLGGRQESFKGQYQKEGFKTHALQGDHSYRLICLSTAGRLSLWSWSSPGLLKVTLEEKGVR